MSSSMTTPRIMSANSPPQAQTKVVGWHYDYLLRCGAILNGQTVQLELIMLPGAPFCLRGIGGYHVEAGPIVSPLTGGFLAITDSNDAYLMNQAIGLTGDWGTGGQNALYEPVYQQLVYGPGSALQVNLTNSSGGNWADARLVFRGTKLFYKERVDAASYPACYTALPYTHSLLFAIGANQTLNDQPMEVKGADLVFRGASIELNAGLRVGNSMADLEFKIHDQEGRPYSSDYIHHSWLFPTAFAQRPGTFYPEIYLPKDRILLFDLFQGGATTADVNLAIQGARIFPK
jgi:hypothetical protein